MVQTKVFNTREKPTETEKNEIIDFLFEHLDEYGDPREDIAKAVGFSLEEYTSFGGFVLEAREGNQVVGAVVVNKTGMKGYIPDNILVYIAMHKDYRGKGIGKMLMQKALDEAQGDVALHVEHNNPARFLYEKVGFKNPYLEMRYKAPTHSTQD
jgi:ribosomal protein S18 acetylase RimI-like enzyme